MLLSIYCWILGDDPHRVFSVEIPNKTVPFDDDDEFREKVKTLDLSTKRPLSGWSMLHSLFPASASMGVN